MPSVRSSVVLLDKSSSVEEIVIVLPSSLKVTLSPADNDFSVVSPPVEPTTSEFPPPEEITCVSEAPLAI